MVCDDDKFSQDRPRGDQIIMLDKIVKQPNSDHMHVSYRKHLIKPLGGTPINLKNSAAVSELQ